jgi:hypothetical protein
MFLVRLRVEREEVVSVRKETKQTEGSMVTQPLQCTQTQQDYQAHTGYIGAYLTNVLRAEL